MSNMTPMMRQYFGQKAKHPDCLLFFRLGDFYELFGDDALVVAGKLGLTLTTRDRSEPDQANRIPMCGVPHHSVNTYIARLVEMGYKVAICEQMEDPSVAKGLVERDIVRIVTPGTLLDSNMLDETANNYIAAVFQQDDAIGVCFADISTGIAHAAELSGGNCQTKLATELSRFDPREVVTLNALAEYPEINKHRPPTLVADSYAAPPFDLVRNMFDPKTAGLLEQTPTAQGAVSMLMRYLADTQKQAAGSLGVLNLYKDTAYVELGVNARRNLELTASLSDGGKRGSLLGVLDCTQTPMGARLLRSDIEKPLRNPVRIDNRLGAVEQFAGEAIAREELRRLLKSFPDIERIVGRVVYRQSNPKELRALGLACLKLPDIRMPLMGQSQTLLQELYAAIDPLDDLTGMILSAIMDEPAASQKEGDIIRDGYHPEVDKLRNVKNSSKGMLVAMEAEERAKTGIKSLKINYNRVFGYYIEVTKSYLNLVPDTYIRKQTLSNCERYITNELKDMETTILSAQDRLNTLECELFLDIVGQVEAAQERFQGTARALARLDVILALSEVAVRNRYCRPVVDLSDKLEIIEGRHPVVEAMLTDGLFVPNDVTLTPQQPVIILTGPNMAGKSTYMRQVALITLMAHMGSFVPAKRAHIGIMDKIFTRIGAQDDLAGGRSTFMVEMTEVADILKQATKHSLLILDEIGRGTSTFDGMAVARAVLEQVSAHLKSKTLFATHYHELTVLEGQLPNVRNFNIAVKKRGKEIIFLRKIVCGGADDSYGVEVARLAGLPPGVVSRADEILAELEAGTGQTPKHTVRADEAQFDQISVDNLISLALREELLRLDVNTLTPLEAMQTLYQLQRKAKG